MTKKGIILGQYFLHLSGPTEQFGIHKELSKGFNVGLMIPWGTKFIQLFSSFLLIFLNRQMR